MERISRRNIIERMVRNARERDSFLPEHSEAWRAHYERLEETRENHRNDTEQLDHRD